MRAEVTEVRIGEGWFIIYPQLDALLCQKGTLESRVVGNFKRSVDH
ncbi:hypothetical protein PL9214500538 [Planktothrix tepida PCC 9214]|uniref:Uncharacterized protein n=1 Tax=Planktothrix tepida PCC 9214 TaxID=671072 RepID=A0A1J1LLE9_9CYAN|nr:hypothetical protein PL9214500538 [Planktothrix tepida PCC 9214]